MLKGQGLAVGEIAVGSVVILRPSPDCPTTRPTRGGKLDYRGAVAQRETDLLARRAKASKLVINYRFGRAGAVGMWAGERVVEPG
jgi:hypothetical protein